jgi:hypothetical protein
MSEQWWQPFKWCANREQQVDTNCQGGHKHTPSESWIADKHFGIVELGSTDSERSCERYDEEQSSISRSAKLDIEFATAPATGADDQGARNHLADCDRLQVTVRTGENSGALTIKLTGVRPRSPEVLTLTRTSG